MLVDTRLSWPIFVILILCVIIPFLDGIQFTFLGDTEVRLIENMQAFLLLFFALFSYLYIRPFDLQKGQKHFWLWAICWWLVLFGRSTSWGRDYLPEVPKIYFRMISILFIASIILPLLQSTLRQEIAYKFKTAIIPIWGLIVAFIGLIISDAVEHDRYIGTLFLTDNSNKNLIEELYEFPLILGLFMVTYGLMKAEKINNKKR